MGIQTSLDDLMKAERIIDAMRLADDLAFEASRDPGPRTLRVLSGAIRNGDSVTVIAAIHALAAIPDEEASRLLSALLSNARPYVREHAAWALGTRPPRHDAIARLVWLVADGGTEGRCGWLEDPWGVSWQIVPNRLYELLGDPDRARAGRATNAMTGMKRLVVAELEAAADAPA